MNERDIAAEAGHVSCAEAREIASRFNASHWRGKAGLKEVARYSITANPKRDDDIRLGVFIDRAEAMERDLEALAALRSHPHFEIIIATIESDRAEWASGGVGGDYLNEEALRVEALDLLLKLLRGSNG
jgi:hypothetical protein